METPALPLLPSRAVVELWEGRHGHSPGGMSIWLGNHLFLQGPNAPALSSYLYLVGASLPWVGAPREAPDFSAHRDQLGRLPGSQSDRLSRNHSLRPEPWCLPRRRPGSAPGAVAGPTEPGWAGLLVLCSGRPLALDLLEQPGFGGVSSMATALMLTESFTKLARHMAPVPGSVLGGAGKTRRAPLLSGGTLLPGARWYLSDMHLGVRWRTP